MECLHRSQRTPEEWPRLNDWNLDVLDEVLYLITPK